MHQNMKLFVMFLIITITSKTALYVQDPINYIIKTKSLRDLHLVNEADNFYLGMELEIMYITIHDKNDAILTFSSFKNYFTFSNWALQDEPSLQNCIEFTSYPLIYENMLSEIPELIAFVIKTNGFIQHNTGLHIHVSRASIEKYKPISNMTMDDHYKYLWWKVNNINYRDEWIKLANRSSYYAIFDNACDAWRERNSERYNALNFMPKRTIEFRMFKSTLDSNMILKYFNKVHDVITNNDDYDLYLKDHVFYEC